MNSLACSMRRLMQAVAFAILCGAIACHASFHKRKEYRVIGDIAAAADVMQVIGAPSVVQVGETFNVGVTTFGDSCIRPDGGSVEIIGLTALITPYDIRRETTCMEYLKPFSRLVKVRFDTVGVAIIRVRGLNGSGEMSTTDRAVVVTPLATGSAEIRAQLIQTLKVQALRGCWAIDVGRFKVTDKTPVDPGQTTLPPFIQLDTVPGEGFMGKPTDFLVRALPLKNGTRYWDGYFKLHEPDSLTIGWSNSVVGMTLEFPYDTGLMRGTATAWTDYVGQETAPIEIRKTECPKA